MHHLFRYSDFGFNLLYYWVTVYWDTDYLFGLSGFFSFFGLFGMFFRFEYRILNLFRISYFEFRIYSL